MLLCRDSLENEWLLLLIPLTGLALRCHRLKKQCYPSESLRRRQALRSQQDSHERVAELEGKLDRLVGLLQTVAHSPDSLGALRKAFDNKFDLDVSERAGSTPDPQHADQTSSDPPTVSSSSSSAVVVDVESLFSASAPASVSGSLLPGEADACLELFRSSFLPHLPFIHLTSETTAQHLLSHRPILMRAILTVTTPSTHTKLERGRELRRVLANATLVENQSGIDLLLGYLVFIAWSNDQSLNRIGNRKMGSLSRPMQMAMSVVSELRWNQPLSRDNHMVASIPTQSSLLAGEQGSRSDSCSLERQRAVLGCFILSSLYVLHSLASPDIPKRWLGSGLTDLWRCRSVSSYFKLTEPMRFTPQMEEYLLNVERSTESPMDKVFATQVRIQLLVQNMLQVREQHDVHYARPGTPSSTPGPESFYLRTAQRQLEELQKSIPPELQKDGRFYVYYAQRS